MVFEPDSKKPTAPQIPRHGNDFDVPGPALEECLHLIPGNSLDPPHYLRILDAGNVDQNPSRPNPLSPFRIRDKRLRQARRAEP